MGWGKAGLVNNLLTEGSKSDAVCLLRLQHKWIRVLSDSAQNPLLSCEEIPIHRDGTSGSSKAAPEPASATKHESTEYESQALF